MTKQLIYKTYKIFKITTEYLFSANFIRNLFSRLHLLTISGFLFNKLTSLKYFKSHNFSFNHNLQTTPSGQQLTTDIILQVVEALSPSYFNFQIYLSSSMLLTCSLCLTSLYASYNGLWKKSFYRNRTRDFRQKNTLITVSINLELKKRCL